MLLITTAPIERITGKLPDGEYYVRVSHGKLALCKMPKNTKPPTEKQIEARKRFAERSRSGEFRRKSSGTSE